MLDGVRQDGEVGFEEGGFGGCCECAELLVKSVAAKLFVDTSDAVSDYFEWVGFDLSLSGHRTW